MKKLRLDHVCKLLEHFLDFKTSAKIRKEVSEHLELYRRELDG